MNEPGVRLYKLAVRVFHRDTMEYVIGPALADLQLECGARQSSRWRRSRVCLRAYASFWGAVAAHLWRGLIDGSPHATADDHRALRRVLLNAAAIGVVVTVVLMLPAWLNRAGWAGRSRSPFDRDLVRALPLLVPQATPVALPAAMLFGTVWAVGASAPRTVRRMVLALGVLCSLLSAGMLGWVIPEANQAYRVVVYRNVPGYSQPPARGLNELTWPDLRNRIRDAEAHGVSGQASLLRFAYHGRMALVATPLIFAALALVLVRRPQRVVSSLLGLLLFVGYYTLFRFDRMVGQGTLPPVLAAWTPDLVAAILIAVMSASRTSRPVGRPSVHRTA
jgi:lipopolysaccharide export LptBFGC system permease protein LptF